MKLSIFSLKMAKRKVCGWKKGGDNIHYYKSMVQRSSTNDKVFFYSLSFNISA